MAHGTMGAMRRVVQRRGSTTCRGGQETAHGRPASSRKNADLPLAEAGQETADGRHAKSTCVRSARVMHKGPCRRGEECGRQQCRWRKWRWHRVAIDGEAAGANQVVARKSRKESLAPTAAADSAAAYMILDNTPSLLHLHFPLQLHAEISKDGSVGDGDVGDMVPREGS